MDDNDQEKRAELIKQLGNDMAYRTIKAIAELITVPSLVGVDYADVRVVVRQPGRPLAVSVFGAAEGEAGADRGRKAALTALADVSRRIREEQEG